MMSYCILFLFLCFGTSIKSQSLPPCAVACALQTLPVVGCSLDNITCQCTSKSLPLLSAECMFANCSMADTLALSKFQAKNCDLPFQDKSDLVLNSSFAEVVITGSIVLLRVATKVWDKRFALEDSIIILALVLAVTSNAWQNMFTYQGFGKHGYSLQEGDLLTILKQFYIAENIYVGALAATKLSLLAFYLRIFQHQYWLRIAVYTTITIIILSTTIISILTIFQCQPVQYFWNKDIHHGACLDQNALAYANSGMSIVQDIAIITLPIPVILRMNMETRRKIEICFMFALGGFGCIVSIIRLQSLLIFGTSIDPTWDYVPVTIWTALELSAGMICSCLPELRTLWHKIFPRVKFSLLPSKSNSKPHTISVRQSWRIARDTNHFLELVNIETGKLDIKWKDETEGEHIEDIEEENRSRLDNLPSNRNAA